MVRIHRAAIEGGTICHVLNRANSQKQIFNKEKNYLAFEGILLEAKEKEDAKRPDHFFPQLQLQNMTVAGNGSGFFGCRQQGKLFS